MGWQGSTVALMKMVSSLRGEDSFLVWKNLSSFFHVLRCIVWCTPALAAQFDRYKIMHVLKHLCGKFFFNYMYCSVGSVVDPNTLNLDPDPGFCIRYIVKFDDPSYKK